MAISWNEIKHRAMEFSREWADESREQAEAKSFWDGFFHVFGISRRRVAGFEEPVNITAAEKMGKLHDGLLDSGYTGHQLEVLLMRLLFCLFADDTAIFDKNIFTDYIRSDFRDCPEIMKRIESTKEFRNSSNRQQTKELA